MVSLQQTAELWALPAPEPPALRLAVVASDEAFGPRVAAALSGDDLGVALEAAGQDVSVVDALPRAPHLVVLRDAGDQRRVERDLRRLARRLPAAIILVVLSPGSRRHVSALLSAGADGLLFAGDIETALPAAVRAAAAGLVTVPAELRPLMQPPALSHRESQILGMAVAGLTNSQIAARLCISESTVKTHLSSAFRRLGVHSRREVAALVFGPDEVLRRTVLGTLHLSGVFARAEQG